MKPLNPHSFLHVYFFKENFLIYNNEVSRVFLSLFYFYGKGKKPFNITKYFTIFFFLMHAHWALYPYILTLKKYIIYISMVIPVIYGGEWGKTWYYCEKTIKYNLLRFIKQNFSNILYNMEKKLLMYPRHILRIKLYPDGQGLSHM